MCQNQVLLELAFKSYLQLWRKDSPFGGGLVARLRELWGVKDTVEYLAERGEF